MIKTASNSPPQTKEMANSKKPKARSSTKKKPSKSVPSKSSALAKRSRPKTLVTGGTGFLGSHLIRHLLDSGVKNLVVLTTSTPSWLVDLGVETVEGSITEPQAVAKALAGVKEIYHLAGKVSRDLEDARDMYSVHVEGTRILCDAAAESGAASLVLASSSGTIAVTETGEITPDETWPSPLEIISRWPYYASKFYQEQVALERFRGKGRRLVILNPSLLVGPGDERLSSTRVILDFMSRKILATPGGGLNFVDVRDVARAFHSAMENGKNGERYLLGAANWTFDKFFGRLERLTKVAAPRLALPKGLAVTGSQILDTVYRQWKITSPVEPQAIEMAEYYWYFDSSKAERELAFDPRDPGETLLDTVNYVRENFLGGNSLL